MKKRKIRNLRPHHLLCMQAYEGKGYSQAFNQNMKEILSEMQAEEASFQLVCKADALCAVCPHRRREDCDSQQKVLRLDQKVREAFGLKNGIYKYREISREIREKMSAELFEEICIECSWYSMGICQKVYGNSKKCTK